MFVDTSLSRDFHHWTILSALLPLVTLIRHPPDPARAGAPRTDPGCMSARANEDALIPRECIHHCRGFSQKGRSENGNIAKTTVVVSVLSVAFSHRLVSATSYGRSGITWSLSGPDGPGVTPEVRVSPRWKFVSAKSIFSIYCLWCNEALTMLVFCVRRVEQDARLRVLVLCSLVLVRA